MSVSIHHLRKARRANEALDHALSTAEQSAMISSAASKLEELFDILQIEHRNDHNTKDTPRRVAKMIVAEIMHSHYAATPEITEFENAQAFDQLLVTGSLEVRSTCAHHMMPIYGHAYVGVLPAADGRIIGLSKYDRIVDHFASRLPMLEALGMESFVTTTPWYNGPVKLEGVRMQKLMQAVGASGKSVTAIALNDYTTDIPIADFANYGVLLATRRDGNETPVRDKRRLFIVYPSDSKPELKAQKFYSRSAWQVAKREVT